VEKPRRVNWSIDRDFDVLMLQLVHKQSHVSCQRIEVPGMNVDVNAIFQIAGIGIIIAMIHTVLKQMGKEDMAHWVTVIGFVVVLFMVVSMLDNLFKEIKTIFLFQ
jgi:stage III sporulation protein AC